MPNELARRIAFAPVPLADDALVSAWIGGVAGVRAARFLRERGGLDGLLDAGFAETTRAVGRSGAVRVFAAAEVLRRLRTRPPRPGDRIRGAADVSTIYGPRLAGERRERFLALALDAKHRIRSEVEIAVGTLSSCPVHPRDAFRPLVREAASAVIFVHNHPSGDPTPSIEDRDLTERLRSAGTILGIRVLDHVIVAAEGSFSLGEDRRVDVLP
jgi:DNA repair protein RadC